MERNITTYLDAKNKAHTETTNTFIRSKNINNKYYNLLRFMSNKLGTILVKRKFANNTKLETKIEEYVAMAKLTVHIHNRFFTKFKQYVYYIYCILPSRANLEM